MVIARRVVAVAAVGLAGVSLVYGCTQAELVGPSSPSTGTAPDRTVTRTPSPAPSSRATAQQTHKEAESAVVDFWHVIDRLSADPKSQLEELTTVSRGSAAEQWRQNIRDYRYERVKQTGSVLVIRPVAMPSATQGLYQVSACVDVTGVDLVDRRGESVIAAGRPPRVKYRYTVQKDDDNWYVLKEKAIGTC